MSVSVFLPGMIWLYRLGFVPALLVLLPYYGWRMWRRGGYRRDLRHRFGLLGEVPRRRPGVCRIWVQAVSVGELMAIQPLLRQLAADPSVEVCLTTTTSTGRALAESKYQDLSLWRGTFPLDWAPCSAAAWESLQPDLAVLMEGELWPEHLHQAARRKIPVLVLNARLSDRSFRRYRWAAPVVRPLLRLLSQVVTSSAQDAERFTALGLPETALQVSGNMKFDVALNPPLEAEEHDRLRAEVGAAPEDLLLLGASTWPGEETMLAQTAAELRAAGIKVRLVLVPRHAERRGEIADSLGTRWGRLHLRSERLQAAADSDIYLADTTGELQRFVQLADLVFIGKTMPPHTEGQTPIEAAGHGKAMLFGPGTSNFRQVAQALVEAGAARRVESPADFHQACAGLLADPARRERMGAAGAAVFTAGRGSTQSALAAIRQCLDPRPATAL